MFMLKLHVFHFLCKMFTIIIICLTTVRIIAYDNHFKSGMTCTSIKGQQGTLICNRGTRVDITEKWLDNDDSDSCAFDQFSSKVTLKGHFDMKCPQTYLCDVTYQRRRGIETFQSLKILFQCKSSTHIPSNGMSKEYHGENCVSVSIWQGRDGKLECRENKTVYIEQIMLGKTNTCKYNRSNTRLAFRKESKITCSNKSSCIVLYNQNLGSALYKYMNVRFQCLDCLPMYSGYPAIINCPAKSVLQIKDIWYNDPKCPAFEYDSSNRSLAYYRNICEHSFQCTIPNNNAHKKTGSIYYYCKVDERTTNCHGEPNYAAIAGGIVGIFIVICIIVGVFLLRKRNCWKWGNVQRSETETDDASNGQPTTSNHQQTQLINSSAAIQVSTSHSVNVDDTTNERSKAYSHIRNIVDDSDIMYDHTVHHAVHSTCDGDYGIAHRRITEDDYDVSGNYHQSFTNKTDPVYN